MISDPDQKIGRPRQLYTGAARRDVVAIDRRDVVAIDKR
jgi:citrate synthase